MTGIEAGGGCLGGTTNGGNWGDEKSKKVQ